MKVVQVSITRSRSVKPADYENSSAEVSGTAQIEDGEDWAVVAEDMLVRARAVVFNNIGLKVPADERVAVSSMDNTISRGAEKLVDPPMLTATEASAAATREWGKPSPGKSRRTAAEMAEDETAEQIEREMAEEDADKEVEAEKKEAEWAANLPADAVQLPASADVTNFVDDSDPTAALAEANPSDPLDLGLDMEAPAEEVSDADLQKAVQGAVQRDLGHKDAIRAWLKEAGVAKQVVEVVQEKRAEFVAFLKAL